MWDFQAVLRINILDYFDGSRSWHEFYDFLWELPAWGKFRAALAMDREHAEYLHATHKERLAEAEARAEEEGDDPEWKPEGRSPEGYTPEIDALHALDERIQSLTRVLIMVNSKTKPPEIQKHQRPMPMFQVLELEDEREEMRDLASRFGMRQD